MTDKELEKEAIEFCKMAEKEAAKLEITVDYYIAEFADIY